MHKKWMLKEFPSEVTQETFPRLWKWRKQQWNNEKDGIRINRKRNRSDTRLVKISLKEQTWWLDLDLEWCYLLTIFSSHSTLGADAWKSFSGVFKRGLILFFINFKILRYTFFIGHRQHCWPFYLFRIFLNILTALCWVYIMIPINVDPRINRGCF